MQEIKEKQRLREAKTFVAWVIIVGFISTVVHVRTLIEKIQLQKQVKAEIEFVKSQANRF